MSLAPTDQIELSIAGDNIVVALRSYNCGCIRTCAISFESALELSLLLDGGTFPWALNHKVHPGLTLQIENLPHERAWLGICRSAPGFGPQLLACVEGDAIGEIGRSLNDLLVAAQGGSSKAKKAVHVHPVEYCYIDQHAAE
jgi:hypothetical protein